MSKKIILSLSLIPIIFVLFIFYIINDLSANVDDELNDIGVLEERKVSEFGYKEQRNHLSEIRDLYSNLEEELAEDEEKKDELISIPKKNQASEEHIVEVKEETPVQDELVEKERSLPKLAIIIDDVAIERQAKKILSLEYKITPSFFPSDSNHPHTYKFAKKEDVFMLHLPLEAKNFSAEEIGTLHVGDSEEKIRNRIETIIKDFPNLKFLNNHTGSKFTSNRESMEILMKILKEKDLVFVDSVTIGSTVVGKIGREMGMTTLRRDIFLDNIATVSSIQKQLKKAVAIAKKKGYAIAIGHPHRATMKALSNSQEILKDVEVVHISEIFEMKRSEI
ncbi:hypothetical protein ThvES_00009430 [Thiovulum sp. ES]|nr:hypothetical protein ThvES_00009430 [Thiovulum sp. ES]